jgi:ribosomal protein S18 acetylase RimI-like enzyme
VDTEADEAAPLVRPCSAAEFAPLVPDAAAVYGAAMARSPATVTSRRDLIRTHLDRPDFTAVVALAGEAHRLIGFGYGYRGQPGQWWHDVVATALGRREAAAWLRDPFELAELHVHPDHQGAGTGRRIIETLLAQAPGATVLLSTHDRSSPARALYRSLGFVDLLEGFRFPGSAELYAVMGLRRDT